MARDRLWMDIAYRIAQESKCVRKKVGAILVKDDMRMISNGYNGTPSGEDNCCEEEIDGELVTKHNVIHAEDNVFRKLLKSPENAVGATLYITMLPCEKCAHLIVDAGITRVVYDETYRNRAGMDALWHKGITVEQIITP